MSSNDIIVAKNFDANYVSYGEVKKNPKTQGKSIYINYGGPGKSIILQTPEMRCPFGINKWAGENGAPDKYDINLSFDGRNVEGPVKTFFEVLNSLDEKLVDDTMVNAKKWFGKPFPNREVVDALYSKTVRYSKDKETGEISTKYEPTFKATLPMKEGKFDVTVWDHQSRTELNLEDIIESGSSRGAQIKLLVSLTGVWIVGNKFGLTWKVKQMIINRAPARIGRECAFVADDDFPAASAVSNDDEDAPAIVRPLRGPPAASVKSLKSADDTETQVKVPSRAAAAGGDGEATSKRAVLPESDDEDGIEP
jgi:hypothetical protein